MEQYRRKTAFYSTAVVDIFGTLRSQSRGKVCEM